MTSQTPRDNDDDDDDEDSGDSRHGVYTKAGVHIKTGVNISSGVNVSTGARASFNRARVMHSAHLDPLVLDEIHDQRRQARLQLQR